MRFLLLAGAGGAGVPAFSTSRIFVPSGEPRPVQASQPGLA